MTNRAGGFAARGSYAAAATGGRDAPIAGGLIANDPPSAPLAITRYKMRAKNSLGALVTWVVDDEPDTDASEWAGGNTPLTGITVAASWTV